MGVDPGSGGVRADAAAQASAAIEQRMAEANLIGGLGESVGDRDGHSHALRVV
jgi:hypothetical protein